MAHGFRSSSVIPARAKIRGRNPRSVPLDPRLRGGDDQLEMDPAAFVRRNTAVETPPLVPEIRLHLATEVTPIWQATEESLARGAVPPPFWAFAWAGGQALARYLLDCPKTVAGRTVLDFGSGSGLVAIAAALAGARHVLAAEIDDFAAAAIGANAALNNVEIDVTVADPIGATERNRDIVTAGDVCYDREMAERVVPWLKARAGDGCLVLLGDPGRAYLPRTGLVECARYVVPTSRELEDRESRETVVWQVLPG
jgi:predicted nicotinamide N-methyase